MSCKTILNILLVLSLLAFLSVSLITVIPDSSAVSLQKIASWIIVTFASIFLILRFLLERQLSKNSDYEKTIPGSLLLCFRVFAACYSVLALLMIAG